MKYYLENYWKNIYQKRVNDKYETQSIQSKEIIEWHKKYINFYIATEFKNCNPSVLDIGCCSGYLTNLFCNFSSEVVGIDYEEGFIIDAKSKYSKPKFVKGDIYNLNKVDGTFDLIVCFAVIQHISDLELALQNVKLKLSDKIHSKVLFTTINKNSIFNRNYFGYKLSSLKDKENFNLNLFSKEQYIKFSKISGLKLTKYQFLYIFPKPFGFLNYFASKFLPSSFSHHIFFEMKNI